VGAVTDTSGAVVPGAKVAVANPDKGFVRNLITNSAGEYTAAKIPIGNYVITTEAPGFQKLVRTGIAVSGGQTLRVDIQLTVGQVTQEVTVSGHETKVETENATVSDVVTGSQLANLNINGRNYQNLLLLTTGAVADNSLALTVMGHNAVTTIYFNGTRDQYNDFKIDGAGSTDDAGGGNSPEAIPNVDGIAEYRISTSNYGADVGKRAGAITEVVTKSGTKDFHGTLWEFVRNDATDANNFFINRDVWSSLNVAEYCHGNAAGPCNAPITPLKHNDWGYNFGGPVYIPGHYNEDKTKTFFFWSENWARYRQGTVINPNVPSLRERQGDFSECDPSSANYNKVVASGCTIPKMPGTSTPFSGDIVPIDPNAATFVAELIPLPNNGPVGYASAPSLPTNYRQESIRVDQNFTDRTSAFFRWTQDTFAQVQIPTYGTGYTYDTVVSDFKVPAKSVVGHFIHSFRPNLLNEAIVSFGSDPHDDTDLAGPTNTAKSITKPANWTAGNLFAVNGKNDVIPAIKVSGGTTSFSEGPYYGQWGNDPFTYTFQDNVVLTVGRHTMKMGMYVMDHHNDTTAVSSPPQGIYTFNTSTPTTSHNGLADMYLGQIAQYTEGTFVNNGTPVGGFGIQLTFKQSYEEYFQDDWKVNHKLTLNLGVRYDWFGAQHDGSVPTHDSNFLPALYNPAAQATLNSAGNVNLSSGYNFTEYGNGLVHCGTGGVPKGCRLMPRNTWAPRFGFAYDPTGSGKTAIRGGFGIFYDILTNGEAYQQGGNPPSAYVVSGYDIAGYTNIVPGPLAPDSMGSENPSGPWTSVWQYNFTVQHEFTGGNVLSVAWVGSLGRHLSEKVNINNIQDGATTANIPALAGLDGCDSSGNCNVQTTLINHSGLINFFRPYQGYSSISLSGLSADSRYESLQANYRKAVGHGVTVQAAYTYSHSIDNASAVNFSPPLDESNLNRWYATSTFNRTNVFVANYIYELPFFRNNSNHFVKGGLGGWQFSGITSFFTGEPVADFNCGESGLASGIGEGVRCNTIGPLRVAKSTYNDLTYGPTPTWFNSGVIAQPLQSQYSANNQAGMFGYMGRDPLTGPGRNNFDLALFKNFQTPWFKGEHSTLQFRIETFNTFNHPQWKTIKASCSSATPYGGACNDSNNLGDGEVTASWDPRNVQWGLKFLF
jgi:hypothetical protein